MMERKEIYAELKSLLSTVPIDREKRTRIEPMLDKKQYRGKAWVVGYSWMRPAATYHGMVNDCVLGWGDTPESALAHAKSRFANTEEE